MKRVRFTPHAQEKFVLLASYGCTVRRSQVLKVLSEPETVETGHRGRRVAQGPLDRHRVLRVVFEERENEIVVVTFYPGRGTRYEGSI